METHEVLLLLAMFERLSGFVFDVTSGEWIRQRALMCLPLDLLMIPSSLDKFIFNTKSTNVSTACKSSEVRVYRPSSTKQ